MSDTPEQRAAHQLAEDAIAALTVAYSDPGDPPGLLVDYVIVVAHHVDDGSGDTMTGHGVYTNPEAPVYRSLGLVTHQAAAFTRALSEDD